MPAASLEGYELPADGHQCHSGAVPEAHTVAEHDLQLDESLMAISAVLGLSLDASSVDFKMFAIPRVSGQCHSGAALRCQQCSPTGYAAP
jgi:hypothetical protein